MNNVSCMGIAKLGMHFPSRGSIPQGQPIVTTQGEASVAKSPKFSRKAQNPNSCMNHCSILKFKLKLKKTNDYHAG